MTDINSPIQPIQPPDDGWERVQRIEGYKQRERQAPPADKPLKPFFFALFATLFKKFFLSTSPTKGQPVANIKDITKDLLAFQQALQSLSIQDMSQNSSYAKTLSALWHKVQLDCNQLPSTHPSSSHFNLLLAGIDSYPPWEEHSLGFYLTKGAGMEWLPIPFMEILLALHLESKKNPLQNTLESWCRIINEIFDFLKESP